MARDHGRVLCSIWQNPDFIDLTDRAQRLYMLLLSQPRLSLCGVIDLTPGRWARLSSTTTEADISDLIDELEDSRFVVVDQGAEELLIRSLVRHDGILSSPNLIQAMWKAWAGVHSVELREAVVDGLPDVAFEVGFGSEKKDYRAPAEALAIRSGEGLPKRSAKGSEKGSPTPAPAPTPSPTPCAPLALVSSLTFDDFWREYPKKDDKLAAERKWKTVTKTVDPAVLVEAARHYAADPKRDVKFTKNAATWLNAGSWLNPTTADEVYDEPPVRYV